MLAFSLKPEQFALQTKAYQYSLAEALLVAGYNSEADDTFLPGVRIAYDP